MTRRSPDPRIALFAGSFNPFTIGHLSIVERGAAMFDKVVVGVGYNFAKAPEAAELASRVEAIERAVAHLGDAVEVVSFGGLTVDEAERHGAKFLLRGVRNAADFEYERSMADINRRLSGIETVLLYTLPELSAVSSSVVRELRVHGRDVSPFLP